jgi:nucleoid DNA-binding protein
MLTHRAETEKQIQFLMEKVQMAQNELTAALKAQAQLDNDIETASKTVEELIDESTDEITAQLHDIDQINAKVRANMAKEAAQEEAKNYCDQYNAMSVQLDELRKSRYELLNSAHLPLPNLSIEDGCLTYNGKRWGDMSGSDQLIVATSIVKCLNPQCQFVLVDKLEQMDSDTLTKFGAWLMGEGMQVIGTRVSTGNECQIIIEDGMIKPAETKRTFAAPMKDWRK